MTIIFDSHRTRKPAALARGVVCRPESRHYEPSQADRAWAAAESERAATARYHADLDAQALAFEQSYRASRPNNL